MNNFRIVVLAVAVTMCVAAISYSASDYWIEEVKQRAVMMKICTEAGGDWGLRWGNWECKRSVSR